jgi:hypothetical protein
MNPEPMSLDQIGKELRSAIQPLSWKQRIEVSAALLENLRKPVGALKIGRKK